MARSYKRKRSAKGRSRGSGKRSGKRRVARSTTLANKRKKDQLQSILFRI